MKDDGLVNFKGGILRGACKEGGTQFHEDPEQFDNSPDDDAGEILAF